MNNKRIIIGVTIGIIAAILWSVVFINVLNSMAGIGIGICRPKLGMHFLRQRWAEIPTFGFKE